MAGIIILSAGEMRAVEAAAMADGVASAALMEKAGGEAAEIAAKAWSQRPVAVICGPGNNGGDGFVAARRLREAGWPVKLALIGDREKLSVDARMMADLFGEKIETGVGPVLDGAGLIVDALFGTGLSRPVDGIAGRAIEAINQSPAPALSIDLPSGIDADSGAVLGVAVKAARTVTFLAKKRGHVLFPGRAYAGAVDIVDIGITPAHLSAIPLRCIENHPSLWGAAFPRPSWSAHKYHRGHVYVVSGGQRNTGAARLAASAAQRIGAGLVTVLAPGDAIAAHASHLTSVMLDAADDATSISAKLQDTDKYRKVALIGPATGVGEDTKSKALAILATRAGAVLDADALMSFEDDHESLFRKLRSEDILTPHTGEFARLFPGLDLQDKLAAAAAASKSAGSILILKGPDTVVAAPDRRTAINTNAPPDLATAGSGDVLAGLAAGLKAQGMPGFEAACAAVWFHGAAAQAAGPGLIAEDLPAALPSVLRALLMPSKRVPGGQDPDSTG